MTGVATAAAAFAVVETSFRFEFESETLSETRSETADPIETAPLPAAATACAGVFALVDSASDAALSPLTSISE
jgi:hypothetical protein